MTGHANQHQPQGAAFASSYAVGNGGPAVAMPAPYALAAPGPRVRPHWSNAVFGVGCVAMLIALVLVLAGVPAHLFYDANGSGKRNKNTSHDMLAMSRSIDQNMKYMVGNMGHEPDHYNGHLDAVDTSEHQIAGMVAAVNAMTSNVESIDSELSGVARTTYKMGDDMEAMLRTSNRSAATMGSLGGNVSELSSMMASLYGVSEQLASRMGTIQGKADRIAKHRTSVALASTKALNAVLPDEVPDAETSLDPGTMGVGGGADGVDAAADDAPAPGAQPAAAVIPGAVQ
jgi:hypothetical protein